MTTTDGALPYEEPGIVTILILASFLLVLNIINHVMDRITYIGLLGQLFIGIAWGTPAGNWLGTQAETVVVNLGYLGLLLLVYEGGLTTSFKSLKANLWLSSFVALTGISLPIGLSYILMTLASATPLQAFAAGAALCSTSLGTTFTVLQTSGLNVTRMGVVLTAAAMMDDVVGLVMVQVLSDLGKASSSFSAVTVIRPIFVSLAFAFVVPLVCRFLVVPATVWLNARRARHPDSILARFSTKPEVVFLVHTSIIVGMVTGASYAGTSNLFAAYLTGAAISWWDSEVPHPVPSQRSSSQPEQAIEEKSSARPPHNPTDSSDHIAPVAPVMPNQGVKRTQGTASSNVSLRSTPSTGEQSSQESREISGVGIFERYYAQPLQRILKPFFFASIGFSIPIKHMLNGSIVWRGIVYTILMFLGKLACGLWLIRMPLPSWLTWLSRKTDKRREREKETTTSTAKKSKATTPSPRRSSDQGQLSATTQQTNAASKIKAQENPAHQTHRPKNPVSLYPSTILGCAMVARGEIGFLISSLAEANSIFGKESNSPLFLIVTWAIMLCTLSGPICVGLLARRLKRLSKVATEKGGERPDVLGIWGFS